MAAGRGGDAVPRAEVCAGGRPPLLLLRRSLGRLHAQPPHHSDLPPEKQARGEQSCGTATVGTVTFLLAEPEPELVKKSEPEP